MEIIALFKQKKSIGSSQYSTTAVFIFIETYSAFPLHLKNFDDSTIETTEIHNNTITGVMFSQIGDVFHVARTNSIT